jgi:hypothetical protein
MGEAKRRKFLDPNFGKTRQPRKSGSVEKRATTKLSRFAVVRIYESRE